MEEPYDDERQHLNGVKNRLEHAIIRVNDAKSDRDHCVDQSKKAAESLAMAQNLQQQIERELNDLNTIDSIIGLLKRLTLPEQLIRKITSDIKQALLRHGEHTPQPLAHSDTEESDRQTDKESETDRQTDKESETDRQTDKESETDRQTDKESETEQTKAQRDRQGEHTDDDIVRYLGSLGHVNFDSRVSVFYPEYGKWYDGTVKPYTPGKSSEKDLEKARESGLFKVLFDNLQWCDINMLQVDFKDLEDDNSKQDEKNEKKRKKSKR